MHFSALFIATFLATAQVLASPITEVAERASPSWNVWLNWKANCGGDSYEDTGAGPVSCRNIYLRNGEGAVSTTFYTFVETCTIVAFADQYCGGASQSVTVAAGGKACLSAVNTKSYLINC